MTAPVAQPPASAQPPKARLVRWPHRLLVIVIVLWAVPGALFVSPWSIGSGLLILALVSWLIVAWLALPVLMLIGGAVLITRLRRVAGRRWLWVAAWVAESAAFLIFGAAMIALLTWAARSAHQRPVEPV